MVGDGERIELVTPIYLNTPMMVSYMAALEEGVVYGRRETTKRTTGTAREGEVKGIVNIPLISSILGVGASGTRRRTGTEDQSEEIQLERQHTAASLFITLRSRLKYELGIVQEVKSLADVDQIAPGNLIEITGDIHGDPLLRTYEAIEGLAQIFNEVAKVDIAAVAMEAWAFKQWPTLEAILNPSVPQPPSAQGTQKGLPSHQAKQPARRSPQPTRIAELIGQVTALISGLRRAAADQPVSDFLLSMESNLRAVLTLSGEFLTPDSRALMLDGQWTVLGTVTRILTTETTSIRLLRRSWLGQIGQRDADELLGPIASSLNLSLPDLTVKGPAIQVLPLAVYA